MKSIDKKINKVIEQYKSDIYDNSHSVHPKLNIIIGDSICNKIWDSSRRLKNEVERDIR